MDGLCRTFEHENMNKLLRSRGSMRKSVLETSKMEWMAVQLNNNRQLLDNVSSPIHSYPQTFVSMSNLPIRHEHVQPRIAIPRRVASISQDSSEYRGSGKSRY